MFHEILHSKLFQNISGSRLEIRRARHEGVARQDRRLLFRIIRQPDRNPFDSLQSTTHLRRKSELD